MVGDSGSGKSLVRAGLIPALMRGRFHDTKNWVSPADPDTTPGKNPFQELATALPDLDAFGQIRVSVRGACEEALQEEPADYVVQSRAW